MRPDIPIHPSSNEITFKVINPPKQFWHFYFQKPGGRERASWATPASIIVAAFIVSGELKFSIHFIISSTCRLKYSHFCFREPLESSNLIFTSCKSEKRCWRSNTRFDKSFAFIQFLSKQTETGHTAAREHPRSEVCHEHVGWEYDQGFFGSDLI